MAQARPVVASPVGVNIKLVKESGAGFLAGNAQEWWDGLLKLVTDAELRRKMGAAGRREVERNYSVDVIAPELRNLFTEIAGQSARR